MDCFRGRFNDQMKLERLGGLDPLPLAIVDFPVLQHIVRAILAHHESFAVVWSSFAKPLSTQRRRHREHSEHSRGRGGSATSREGLTLD